jgi:hypothetical protein
VDPGLPLITLEIFLGFGVPVAWALWELHALRRDRLARERSEADAAASVTVGDAAADDAGRSAP